jgi:hypothetical protein
MRNPLLPESNEIEPPSAPPLHEVLMYAQDNLTNEDFSQELLDDLRVLENFLIEDLKSERITQDSVYDLSNSLLALLKLKDKPLTSEEERKAVDSEEIFYEKLADFQRNWIKITQIDNKTCLNDRAKWWLSRVIGAIWIVSLLSMTANMIILINSEKYQHTKWHKTLNVIFQVTIGITFGIFAPLIACAMLCCFCNCLFPGRQGVWENDLDQRRHPRYYQKKEQGEKIADIIKLMFLGNSENNSDEFNELDSDARITDIEMQRYPSSRV